MASVCGCCTWRRTGKQEFDCCIRAPIAVMACSRMNTSSAVEEQTLAAALAKRFVDLTGHAPAGVFGAPGRVNLIGEHTDYNDGFVLPVAIAQKAVVAIRLTKDDRVRIWSDELGQVEHATSQLAPGSVADWSAYVAGALWAAGLGRGNFRGAEVLLSSSVPVGAGLSSSAAVECATVLGAMSLQGRELAAFEMAMLAHRAEFEFVGMPCGIMDQSVSMCAQEDHALFLDCRTKQTEQIPIDLGAADLELLVIDTRAPHRLNDGAYAERRAACEQAAQQLQVPALRDATLDDLQAQGDRLSHTALKRARHVISENDRVLQAVKHLRASEPQALAELINASHASLRDDFEVTVPELDVAQETAVEAGAVGARMVGGGFGGSVLALLRSGAADRVTQSVEKAFDEHGFAPPKAYAVEIGPGARRLL